MREQNELCDARIGDPVVGEPANTSDLHIAAISEAAEVAGDPALRQPNVRFYHQTVRTPPQRVPC